RVGEAGTRFAGSRAGKIHALLYLSFAKKPLWLGAGRAGVPCVAPRLSELDALQWARMVVQQEVDPFGRARVLQARRDETPEQPTGGARIVRRAQRHPVGFGLDTPRDRV